MEKIDNDLGEVNQYSLRGRVFIQLENDILDGKYNPGDSLIESKLCTELGVSRTPIREAIRQLELEGLVTSIPNKGALVVGLNKRDIEDIFELRIRIEGFIAKKAAENITQEQLNKLKEIIDFEEFYTPKNDIEQLLKLDNRFHEIIYKASGSRLLMRTFIMFHHYIQSARHLSLKTPQRAEYTFEEHKAIYKAIVERNGDLAEELTAKHIKNAAKNFLEQNGKQNI